MIAKGGAVLLTDAAAAALQGRLLPLATLLTPNMPEAEALTGRPIADRADMARAGAMLRGLGAPAVLLKGGHMRGRAIVTDLLVDR